MTRAGDPRRGLSRRALETRKFAAIGQLASGIAHEINTPTQYIGDNLRFLLDAFQQLAASPRADADEQGGASTEIAYLLEEIPSAIAQSLDGIEQVSRIVGAVKRFAMADIGRVSMVDLNGVIESVLAMAHNEWKYVVRVERELEPSLPLVPCAEGEVRQVVLSLLLYAARASGAASTGSVTGLAAVTITSRLDGEHVTMSVADTGRAMRGCAGEGIPRPTGSSRASRRLRSLAFVDDVVARQGGEVRVMSSAGNGTTVVVRLPLGVHTVSDHPPIAPAVDRGASSVA